MTIREARGILVEMQKWRRVEPPYDKVSSKIPHSPKEFGIAIDTAIEAIDLLTEKEVEE